MRRQLRAIVCALAASLAILAFATPAHAGQQCAKVILQEWVDTGTVSTTYDIQCYETAVTGAPDDLLLYSSFEGDVFSAKRRAVRAQARSSRGGTSGANPSPGSPAPTPPPAPTSPASQDPADPPEPDAIDPAEQGKGESAGAGADQDPGSPDAGSGTASGQPPTTTGDGAPGTLDAEAAASIEVVDSGSTPIALIVLVVVAVLLILGSAAALILRRRNPGSPEWAQ